MRGSPSRCISNPTLLATLRLHRQWAAQTPQKPASGRMATRATIGERTDSLLAVSGATDPSFGVRSDRRKGRPPEVDRSHIETTLQNDQSVADNGGGHNEDIRTMWRLW